MGMNGEEPKHFPRDLNFDENSDDTEGDTELMNADDDFEEYEIDDGDLVIDEISDDEEIVPDCDHATITFENHQAPVYACEFHPNGRLGASGCENEMLYVWDCLTKEILLEEKFQDSVTLIKFNHDGKYLVAVDMIGNFVCWKYSNSEFTKIKTMKLKNPSWMEWHPMANVLLLAENVYFCMWKVPTFETVKYFTLEHYSEAGCLMPDGKNALIGYDDGHAVILDLSTFNVSVKLKHHEMNHDHGIVSVDAYQDNNVVALGTKNGRVMLFTTKNPRLIGMLNIPLANESFIELVKFGRNSLTGCLIVAFKTHLHIYDQSKLVLRHEIILSGHAIKSVCIEPVLYVATSKAVVDVCNCRTGIKLYSFKGHTRAIMYMTLSKDHKRIMTGSDDSKVKIFDLAPLDSLLNEDLPHTSQ